MRPRIYIETHGCQMNEADSETIARRAERAGYDIAERFDEASVVVLNTCTVRDNAEQRAYGRINHWKSLKLADPSVKVVVAGCLAEQDRDRMLVLAPHVDAIFGTKELSRLGDALAAWRDGFVDEEYDEHVEARALLAPVGGRPDGLPDAYGALRAFVNVQRGCSYYCTFCIVPHVRGRFDHRPIGEVVAEVRGRIASGAREITLVGQTVNAWREPATGADFADLLEVVASIDGLERLTFVTSHPKDFTEKLARTMGAIPSINPRMHLPFQSASNPVLRRMNRKYTIEEYRDKLAMIDAYVPNCALTTDIVVAFPGESEDDFEKTVAFCAERRFAQAYMFIYSPRRGTPASHWEQIPASVGGERLRRLAAVVDAGVSAYHAHKVGSTVRVLVHGPSRRDAQRLSGKTVDNVTAAFASDENPKAPDIARPWADVRVDAAHVWGISGTLLRRAATYDAAGEAVAPPVIDLIAVS